MSKVKLNDTVRVHYTGKLASGEIFDSSADRGPLEFTIGSGQLIEGFDKGVIGMELNETRTIQISADQAYGPVNQQLIQEVSKSQLPDDMQPEIGQSLIATHRSGEEVELVITEVHQDHIVVDANHPLAGRDLVFDVQLVEIVGG